MKKSLRTSVLIVGAGPVGLSLAIDLGWRGVDCILVDQSDGTSELSKIGLVSIRSMELFRRWGVAENIKNCGFPPNYRLDMVFCTSLSGFHLSTRSYGSMADQVPKPYSPEKKQRCPQLWLDPILREHLKRFRSVRSIYNCKLNSFAQSDDEIVAELEDGTGEPVTVRAEYIVGCDGARSTVRNLLDIPMTGDPALSQSMSIYITAPDLVTRHDKGEAERYLLVGDKGIWGNLTVIDGSSRWRLTIIGATDPVGRNEFDADAWVKRCMGSSQIPYHIDAVLPWRRSRLLAKQYSVGRALIAGDAAHVMSPTGAFGMNTGICDAANLGWKLEAAVNKWAGRNLLASYDLEQRPVGLRNMNAAADNFSRLSPKIDFSLIFEDTPAGEDVRREIGTALGDSTRLEWESDGISLGYRYEDSPIGAGDSTDAPADLPDLYVQTAKPGHRAPHAWLPDGRSTLDLFGKGFVLLRFDRSIPVDEMLGAAASKSVPLQVIDIESDEIARLYGDKLVLVRPDGHVAWRSDRIADPRRLIDLIRGAADMAHQ